MKPTINKIKIAYLSKENKLINTLKEYEKIKNTFNKKITVLSKEGDNIGKEYMRELIEELQTKLNISIVKGEIERDNLIELFIDNNKAKTSLFNRKSLKNPHEPFTFRVQTEQDIDYHENLEETIPDELAPKQAAEHICNRILDFENSYHFKVKWFR